MKPKRIRAGTGAKIEIIGPHFHVFLCIINKGFKYIRLIIL